MKLDIESAMMGTFIVALYLLNTSTATRQSFVTSVVDGIGTSRGGAADDILSQMNILSTQYTPKCLTVVIVPREVEATWSPEQNSQISDARRISAETSNFSFELNSHIFITAEPLHQFQKTLESVNSKIGSIISCTFVSYIVPFTPVSSFMASLTALPSNIQLTRYYFFYTQNLMVAEKLLLDSGLAEEENVAVVIKQEFHNKTLWSVLTRQLLHPSGSPKVLKANTWSRDTGFTSTQHIFPDQMENFYGKELRGSVMPFSPFIMYDKIEGSLVVKPKPSLEVYILGAIAQQLNFTYVLVKPEDGQWGSPTVDGHWTGVVGDSLYRHANFSFCLKMNLERRKVIDFTRVYYYDPLTFVTGKTNPSSLWKKLITPFSSFVWVVVVCGVGGTVLFYDMIDRAQTAISSSRSLSSHTFMHIFGSFLGQTLSNIPWLLAGRVVLGFWLVYSLLVTTYYKTSLTSTLAVPFKPPTINTLQQLLSSNINPVMVNIKGASHRLFETSEVPLYQKVYKNLQYFPKREMMSLVTGGQYGYINYKTPIEFTMVTTFSKMYAETKFHIAMEEFFPGGYSWGFPKGSPYLRIIDRTMGWCVMSGLTKKWLKDLYKIYEKKQTEEKSSLEARDAVISSENELGPFFILLFGAGGGASLFFLELLKKQY
ncbi:hypothetical protein Pcinc_007791 [Petrolisthes cinctipes]|uniref:Ionotropic glutamate receptor L-glutamate and glycine-binding domain-containing protein n=1 Tax=Petrolisthes cinctipes TaxID=88211 RepID=A0AAE1G8M7_PETCI|nr:hypothetical protein Pcinc_007791 [Petrolisthes cinctipes]